MRIHLLLGALFFLMNGLIQAQDGLPFDELNLNNLEEFQTPSDNWQIAGDLFMDLFKRYDNQPDPGTGILVNTSSGESPEDIFTNWEHEDLDLKLEFMMARESNSGIYFQGRYELQMLDSWGVMNPKYNDMGGVYQWREGGKAIGGIAPRINASRAPGLWQRLEVKFKAPRFDDNGEKIAHAKLEEVKLNGVMIHENVNLVHPTTGAISDREAKRGPLRIQGDHGPVAFRNIRYKNYRNSPVELKDLTFRYYEGEIDSVSDFVNTDPLLEGSLKQLSLDMLKVSSEFSVIYKGELFIEEPGEYLFDLRSAGGNRLAIDGNVLIESSDENQRWQSTKHIVKLTAGSHPIEVVYFRGDRSGQPALGLMVEGPGIKKHALHDPADLPVSQEDLPLLVEPQQKPVVIQGFMEMGERVHTHTAAVGYPGGINFAFDQNNGSLLKIWKGNFIDASTMWSGRGGGYLSLNEDAAITLSDSPSLANLNSKEAVWPDTLQQGTDYTFNHYRFDEKGHLIFNYQHDRVIVQDRLYPNKNGKELKRTIEFRTVGAGKDLFFRIAKGEYIEWMSNGVYQVNDKTYYIKPDRETQRKTRIRTSGNGQELVIPITDGDKFTLNYSYIW